MNNSFDIPEETYQLFDGAMNCALLDEEGEKLEQLLLNDARLRENYFLQFQLDTDLAILFQGDQASERTLQHIDSLKLATANQQATVDTASPRAEGDAEAGHLRRGWWTFYDFVSQYSALSLLVSALTMAIILLSMALIVPERQPAGDPEVVSAATIVAELTAFHETTWDAASHGNLKNRALFIGDKLVLKSGLAEITYETGTRVVIEGPIEYVVAGTNRGTLTVGKLVARADGDSAIGFKIMTPLAVIEDLGTEFGVEVNSDGRTDLFVSDGKVSMIPRANGEAPMPSSHTTIAAGFGARIEPGTAAVRVTSEADNSQFAHLSAMVASDPDAPIVAPTEPMLNGLALWLAADQGVEANANGLVSMWRDARGDDVALRGRVTNDAQRPTLVPDALGGQPALRFAGTQSIALPNLGELGWLNSGYEVFIVAQCRSPKVNFLLAGPHTHYEMHLNHYAMSVGMQFIPNGTEYYAKGQNSDYADGRPHLFAARVDQNRGHRCIVRVDQQDQPDVRNKDERSTAAGPLRIGSRSDGNYGLHGDIAEVLIYRDALSHAQRQQVEAYLAEKYGL